MMSIRKVFRDGTVIALLLLLFPLFATPAAAVCVGSGDTLQLQAELAVATNADTPTVIRLEQGDYDGASDLVSYPVADLEIIGGYLPTPDHRCADREPEASKTQISFSGLFMIDSDALIRLEGLTLGKFSTPSANGISIAGWDTNLIELTNVRITSLGSPYTDPVILGYWGGSMTDIKLTNVQIDGVVASADPNCAVYVALGGFANVIANHVTADLSGGDFCFGAGDVGGSKRVALWNSIFWDRAAGFLIKALHDVSDDEILFDVDDVDFSDFSVSPADSILFDSHFPSGQFDPLWTNPDAGDYSILNSPAANAGTENNPGGDPLHADIVGNARPVGSAPDMGAYESPFDDYGRIFTVTNTNDVIDVNNPQYLGSLRWALNNANAGTDAALIKFALPSCPSTILLNSPLPNIWVPLEIDGYTQAGSSPNTDAGSLFNGTLCVTLRPVDSSVTPAGLTVPPAAQDASLTVRGLRIGGFAQGIQLWNGFNHQIVGNEFGNLASGFQVYGFTVAAIHVETGAPVIIGGSNPADRNLFLNAISGDNSNAAGVLIGAGANSMSGCQIIGNLFGVSPDGTFATPNNENGILLQGSGCSVAGNYLAGNTKDAIRLIGGSHNVIQNNIIGVRLTPGEDFDNPGAGIRITNGANDNVIGAGDGFYGPVYSYQNIINDMNAGGILVSNSTGNTIRGNAIYGNGLATGLNLDLGGDGPTPNDPGDADGGVNTANDLMNYPVPHAVAWGGTAQAGTVALTISGSIDVPPGNYLIDAYYDLGCSPTGRGGGSWVGEQTYTAFFPGAGAFSVPINIPFLGYDSVNGRVSLTATSSDGHQSTSEFSRCLSVDTIFNGDFAQ